MDLETVNKIAAAAMHAAGFVWYVFLLGQTLGWWG